MKRDYIEEILSKNQRTKHNERDRILSYRKSALDGLVEHCKKFIDIYGIQSNTYFKEDNEIHRYIPIGTIACSESYFRAVVKELIDFGSPFSENAANFNKTKDIKFDFAVALAIQGKKLSVDDFISHLLPIKNLDDINTTLEVLTGKDFLHELKPYFFYSEDFDEERGYENYLPSHNELTDKHKAEIAVIYDDVKETFRLRNIFCHEAAESEIINTETIYKCYESTFKFLEATNEFIWNLIEPDRPTSNYELAIKLDGKRQKLTEELEKLVKENAYIGDEINRELLEIHDAWKTYKDTRVEAVGKSWEGGSGQGIAMLSEENYLLNNRITELKEDIKAGKYLY